MTPPWPEPPAFFLPILHALDRLARQRGQTVWLTGGAPRDLLLGLSPPDLDLCASGDALALGRELAARLEPRLKQGEEGIEALETAGYAFSEGKKNTLKELSGLK